MGLNNRARCDASVYRILIQGLLLTLLLLSPAQAEVRTTATPALILSEGQRLYLDSLGTISICVDPDWLPFEQIDSHGNYTGMLADYAGVISDLIETPFSLYPTENYPRSLEALKAGACQLIVGEVATDAMLDDFLATAPYFTSPRVFAVHADRPLVSDFSEISHLKTGVVASSPAVSILPTLYPNIDLVRVKNTDEGLRKVAAGEIDTFVNVLGAISYSLQQQSMSLVKIGGAIPANVPLSMLVNKEHPVLVDILNQAIPFITLEARQKIFERWLAVRFEQGNDWQLFWSSLLVVTLISGLVISGFIYWVRKLTQEVRRRQSAEQELRRMAMTDSLTGLPNRARFLSRLKATLRLAERHDLRTVLLLVDLDRFKPINDRFGHQAGDAVLQIVARRLEKYCVDCELVARQGGDEFAILILAPEQDPMVTQLVDKLGALIRLPITLRNEPITVGASIGLAWSEAQGEGVEMLIAKADSALYEAKAAGRDCYRIYAGELEQRSSCSEQAVGSQRVNQLSAAHGNV